MAYYETYEYAWLVYLAAALGVYWCVVKLSKYWLNQDIKTYFRLFWAVVLFTPANHTMDGISAIAPAFIVAAGELLTNGLKAAMQGVVPLLLALFVGAVALALQAYVKANKQKVS